MSIVRSPLLTINCRMADEASPPSLPKSSSHAPKALVIGGGPAGVFSAIKLLERGFHVRLVERFGEINGKEASAISYHYAIDSRGSRCLFTVDPELPEFFVRVGGPTIHFSKPDGPTKTIFNPYPPHITMFSVPRVKMVPWLYDRARDIGGNHLEISMGWTFLRFENDGRLAIFERSKLKSDVLDSGSLEESETLEIDSYDFVIGADGVKSRVRKELVRLDSDNDPFVKFKYHQKRSTRKIKILPKIHSSPTFDKLVLKGGPPSFHIFFGKKSQTYVLYAPDAIDSFANGVMVSLETENFSFGNWNHVDDVRSFFRYEYPDLYKIYNEIDKSIFENIYNSTVSTGSMSTYCSKYNYKNILLIGDAAHSMNPSLGQGCNSSLDDSYILDKIFEESGKIENINFESAFEKFTKQRKDEMDVIIKFSEDPPYFGLSNSKFSKLKSFLRQTILKNGKRFLPFVKGMLPRPTHEDVSYFELKRRLDEEWKEARFIVAIFFISFAVLIFAVLIPLFSYTKI